MLLKKVTHNLKKNIRAIRKTKRIGPVFISRKVRKELLLIVVGILVIFLFFSFIFNTFFLFGIHESIDVRIPRGSGLRQVGKLLESRGLIQDEFWFVLYGSLRGYTQDLKAGRYVFGGRVSLHNIMTDIVAGKSIPDDKRIVIYEGANMVEIDKRLSQQGIITPGAFVIAASSFNNSNGTYEFLPVQNAINLEGYLFPDTYHVKNIKTIIEQDEKKDDTKHEGVSAKEVALIRTEIVRKMLNRFREKVYAPYSERLEGIDDLKEKLILASIITTEVEVSDMRTAAGVLYNRMQRGMRLQVDITLVHAKCYEHLFYEDKTMLPIKELYDCDRRLISGDRKIDSPFNTYIHKGLPPAPIGNPGAAAVFAALYPESNNYFFYLSPGDGTTLFSETAEEHETKRARYLQR